MQRALIVGDSGGIGGAMRRALSNRLGAVAVDGLSRRDDGLDICDENSVARVISALDEPYDLVFVATGALSVGPGTPEKSLSVIAEEGLVNQFKINALGPALVLKHTVPLLPRDRRCVVAVLSARVGSISDNRLGGWYGYRAAKAALNQIVRTAAIEIARTHKQAIVVALHPGTVATAFTQDYQARHKTVTPEVASDNLLRVISGLNVSNTGQFLDYAGQQVPW